MKVNNIAFVSVKNSGMTTAEIEAAGLFPERLIGNREWFLRTADVANWRKMQDELARRKKRKSELPKSTAAILREAWKAVAQALREVDGIRKVVVRKPSQMSVGAGLKQIQITAHSDDYDQAWDWTITLDDEGPAD